MWSVWHRHKDKEKSNSPGLQRREKMVVGFRWGSHLAILTQSINNQNNEKDPEGSQHYWKIQH